MRVTIANTAATSPGFVPIIDLTVPTAVTYSAATAAGRAATLLGPFSLATSVTHPITGATVPAAPGSQLYVVRLPLSSMTSGLGPIETALDFTVQNAPTVTIDAALMLSAKCGFAYGADALNNPGADAPVYDDAINANVISRVVTVTSRYAAANVCQGNVGPTRQLVLVDVAEGVTLTLPMISTVLGARLQTTAVTDGGAGGVITLPTGPGGTAVVAYASIVGAPGVDRTITIDGNVLIGTVTQAAPGTPVSVVSTANVHGAGTIATPLTYTRGSTANTPALQAAATVRAHAMRVDEAATPVPSTPNALVDVTVTLCVAQDFSLQNVSLVSVLPNGTSFMGNATPPGTATGDDPTTVTFSLGSLGAGTSTVTYRAQIDEAYVSTARVRGGDTFATTQTASARVGAAGANFSVTEATSGSDATLTATPPTVAIAIAAVNSAPVAPPRYDAGDVVTFRIDAALPSGNQGAVTLDVFLPPVFTVTQNGASGSASANTDPIRLTATHNAAAPVPWTTTAAQNHLRFVVPATVASTARTIAILADFTVGSAPVEDGLVLTTPVLMSAATSSATPVTGLAVVDSTLDAPELTATLSAAPTTGVDAGSIVTYTMQVTNVGHSAASAVLLRATLPTGLGSGALVSVTDGLGAVPTTGDLFAAAGGLSLTNPVPSTGFNTITVTFTAVVGVAPASATLTTTGSVVSYQNSSGGTYARVDATAAVTTKPFVVTGLRDGGSPLQLTIGETIQHITRITAPEGTTGNVVLVLTPDPELLIVSVPVVTYPAGVTGGNAWNAGTGTLTLGTVANANTNDAVADDIFVRFDVRVANNAAANDGDVVDVASQLAWNGGGSASAVSPSFDIEEPALALTVTSSPGPAQAGDTVSWTATVTVPAGTTKSAHDIVATATASAQLINPSITVTGDVTAGPGATVTWPLQTVGQTATLLITATVDDSASLGATLTLPLAVTWTSLAGAQPGVERTGAGGIDDYRVTAAANVTVANSVTLSNTLLAAAPNDVTIGDPIEYEILLTTSRGNLGNVIIEHRLPSQVGFVTTASFTSNLQCNRGGGFVACTAPTPTFPSAGVVRWDLGSVRSTGNAGTREVRLVSRVRIANAAGVGAGQTFTTEAAALSRTATSSSATITEPSIASTGSLSPTVGVDGGDTITITGAVVASGHLAHDVRIALPFGTSLGSAVASSADCSGVLTFDTGTNTLIFSSVAATCNYVVTARISDTIAAGSTIAMTGLVTWSSQPAGNPDGRNGSGTPAFNNYRRNQAFPSITTLGGSLGVTAGTSSEPGTTDPALYAGEAITYDLAVTVPDGTSPTARVLFTPPPGVRVLGATVSTVGFAGTVPPLTSPTPRQSGQAVTLTLGNVVANATAGQVDNTFHVLVAAAGTFDARNRATPNGQVAATLTIGAAAPVAAPTQPAVSLVLPRPRLSLGASRVDAGVGATFDLLATLDDGAAPVGPFCDTQVTFRLPQNLTAVDPASDGLDNDGDGATDETDEDDIAPGATVTIPVVGCVTATRQLALRLTVGGVAPLPHATIDATLGRYYTLADVARRERLSPAADAFDTDGQAGVDELGDDEVELEWRPDSDSDGLSDADERTLGLDPRDADTDDDGLRDGLEAQPSVDTDGDGLVNARDPDSDNDGLFDGTERGITAASPGTDLGAGAFIPDADGATTTNPLVRDSDGGGRSDGAEDADHDGALDVGERDPNAAGDDPTVADSDSDGLGDLEELALGTSPTDNDSDDDGVVDGLEANYTLDVDRDGLTSARDADSDGDGVLDGTELGVSTPAAGTFVEAGRFVPDADAGATRTSPLLVDTDRGGASDGHEDANRNGRVDAPETDPRVAADDAPGVDFDADGWPDAFEAIVGTSSLDPDSDDDGVLDGAERDGAIDSDGDGLINARDADSDDDGLFDGTEDGVADAAPRGTDLAAGRYLPDADPVTRTSPVAADTDRGGVADGAEDPNRNGRVDGGETNPLVRTDDVLVDSDSDRLSNAQEAVLGTDPADADSDDDGLLDGAEANAALDSDGDGAIGALDPDSDSDGLFDGTERGVTSPISRTLPLRGTDVARGFFIVDAAPATLTKMVVADTDRGGVSDGGEDRNHNGRVDAGETDPLVRGDDTSGNADGDGDGLTDAEEAALRSDPADRDSDDDGVLDGAERDYAADSDGDGLVNVLDVDSDDDGLYDGTELGVRLPDAHTNISRGHFVADADSATRTSPVRADTDGGGAIDGNEDIDGNGRVDFGETDPRAALDDTVADDDGDGLANAVEARLGTRRNDADSDDDGVQDGSEPNWRDDHDGDGLPNALDADSDNDVLFDGTESQVTAAGVGTDVATGTFVADADPATGTNPLLADSDRGGALDGDEDVNGNGRRDAGERNPLAGQGADDGAVVDSDGDGLADALEARLRSSPTDADSDDDGLADGAEPNLGWDADGDGLVQVVDADSDNDGVFDGTERGITAPLTDTDTSAGHFRADADSGSRTQMLFADTDRGGVIDGFEDLDKDGAVDSTETDPDDRTDDGDADTADGDTDGLPNVEERALGTDPADADSDDDGILDGNEPNLRSDADRDGLVTARDADSDGDGVLDGTELGLVAPQRPAATDLGRGAFRADLDPGTQTLLLRADHDGGGARDGREDQNYNGRVDVGETDPRNPTDDGSAGADSDGDGLGNGEELLIGTNPNDADTDDDGLRDGEEPNAGADADGDGLPNARDADSDNDRLFDGTERGVTVAGPGTDITRGAFRADTDPATRTNPLVADTDRGGVADGSEDIDRDGAFDGAPETDPNLASDDTVPRDSDGDGLPDAEEVALGTDPADVDSDDDGLLDGAEPNLVADSDGDGLLNPLDPDSDDDGLFDGTERGVAQPGPGTDRTAGHFIADADTATTTNPLARDSDGGGLSDGAEDPNRDGRVQANERNPRDASDDAMPVTDSDGDGLSDAQEAALGTSPTDGDTDDDGLLDGDEPNPGSDGDRDGAITPRDADSDGDGVLDGTERGVVAGDLTGDTDTARGRFVPDGDPATTTFMVVRDSDRGGVIDGLEDRDSDGARDAGESDPRERTDDDVLTDSDGDTIYDVIEDVRDSDRDGVRDFLDLDSDGDAISDAVEAGDAMVATPPIDTDRDGTADYRDADSDGDTVTDRAEAGDGDLATPPRDADGDRTPDYRDADSDGDGLPDAMEAGDTDPGTAPVDTDGDGTPDLLDLDSDADTVLDATDNCPIVANTDQADENRNGIGNICEGDDDGDGVLERVDNCPGLRNPEQSDVDNDGQGDPCDADANGDGLPDRLSVEGGCSSGGGAGGAVALVVLVGLVGLALRRRRRGASVVHAAALVAAISALAASPARAQLMVEEARDFSVERFRWALDEHGILGVESAAVPEHGMWAASLWLGYARAPLVVYERVDGQDRRAGALVAYRVASELSGSLALWGRLELGLAAPLVLSQGQDDMLADVGPVSGLGSAGLGDVRLTGKVALVGPRAPVAVAVAVALTAPSSTGDDYRGEDGVTFAPEVLLARQLGRARLGANLGYKARQRAELLDLAIDDEVYAQLGAGVGLRGAPVTLEGNLALATAAASLLSRANHNHAELLGGVTYDLPGPLVATLVGGLGLSDGAGTPKWRTLLALRFGALAPGLADRDGDRLVGAADKCPDRPEDNDKFEDADGCPDPDNDGDGVRDADDAAPDEPEDKDGFEDKDGAPDLDNDGDKVPDVRDACRDDAETVNGVDDADGCPDTLPDADGDGVRDVEDKCPSEREDLDGFADTDGCPDLDNDEDKVADRLDRCPAEPGPVDNAGCPDNDRDGDGVVDRLDNCPDEKGQLRHKGCAARQLVTLTAGRLELAETIYFKTGKAEIDKRSFRLLDNAAAVLRAHPEVPRIDIEGHTDDRGDDAENKELSQRRAEAVVTYLVTRGVEPQRLRAIGYGEEQPIADNKRSRGRAANRRVVFRIVTMVELAPGAAAPAPSAAPAP